ncbi:unnamed protein product, partial [Mesorhabditis belari]|uniref:ADP-ribosylation factor-related protein 1 n=1 Tax=Mesorhabditis belari TaxID=2138241 RepID=A0AAF3F279_9BILA
MYTLSVGLYEHFFAKHDYYIVIVGLDNAGKTTFLEQIKAKFIRDYGVLRPSKITSTVGLNVGKVEVGQVRLNFWDLGGQEDLRTLWNTYYSEASALIFVIDGTRRELFDTVSSCFYDVMKSEFIQQIPVLVAVNKSELDGAATASEIRTLLSDDEHRSDLAVLPVSALEGHNIDRCVRWLVRSLQQADQKLQL